MKINIVNTPNSTAGMWLIMVKYIQHSSDSKTFGGVNHEIISRRALHTKMRTFFIDKPFIIIVQSIKLIGLNHFIFALGVYTRF